MTTIGFEIDHQIRRLGLMGLKARSLRVGPVGEINHHAPSSTAILFRLDGFHDVEAVAVEKVGVVAE